MSQTDITKNLYTLGSLLAVAGAAIKLFENQYSPYIFSVGAAILIGLQIKSIYDNREADRRQKRLGFNGLLAVLMLAVAAYFMFTGANSWVVAVLIYALTTIFLSFRGNSK